MQQSSQIRATPVLQGPRPVEDDRNVSRLWDIEDVPNRLKTAEICNGVVKKSPYHLEHVPDRFITQEICDGCVFKRLI